MNSVATRRGQLSAALGPKRFWRGVAAALCAGLLLFSASHLATAHALQAAGGTFIIANADSDCASHESSAQDSGNGVCCGEWACQSGIETAGPQGSQPLVCARSPAT